MNTIIAIFVPIFCVGLAGGISAVLFLVRRQNEQNNIAIARHDALRQELLAAIAAVDSRAQERHDAAERRAHERELRAFERHEQILALIMGLDRRLSRLEGRAGIFTDEAVPAAAPPPAAAPVPATAPAVPAAAPAVSTAPTPATAPAVSTAAIPTTPTPAAAPADPPVAVAEPPPIPTAAIPPPAPAAGT